MDNLRALKSNQEDEVVERAPAILPVKSLKAPTSSTTIFPPGCSTIGGLLGEEGPSEEEVDEENETRTARSRRGEEGKGRLRSRCSRAYLGNRGRRRSE